MEQFKIRVNNEAESKEAQELFFALGAKCAEVENNHESIQLWGDATITSHSKHDEVDDYCFKEITLPKLRDIVVLHRNDVKDATHKYIGEVQSVEHKEYLITKSDTLYAAIVWDDENQDSGTWEFFKTEEEAEKAAVHCKSMLEAARGGNE